MLDLSTPTRQSKKSIFLYVLKNVKGLLIFVLYAVFGIGDYSNLSVMIGLTVVFLVIGLVSPILKYYFFTFHVENDELIIRQGVLNKERKSIPLERIQSVNIQQNVVQRFLQLVSVEVETAGSKAKELEIPGLDREFAESFKNLLKDKTAKTVSDPAQLDDSGVGQAIENEEVDAREVLLKLSLLDIMKVGITQNHLRSGLLALGVVIGFWYKIKDIVERFYGNIVDEFVWQDMLGYASLSLILLAVGFFIVIAIVVSILSSFNKYYGFQLQRKGNYLEIEMGLLNRREVKIPINKIQILEFHTNPLRRLLNYHTAKIFQAQSEESKTTSADVPACSPQMMELLQKVIFDQTIASQDQKLQSIASSHARLNLYILSVPMLAAMGVMIYFEVYPGVIPFLAILMWTTYRAYRDGQNTSIATSDELMVMKKGWLFHSIMISPVFKMQAVEKWRSIFLERRQQIHFKLHTAAGSRGLRYFREDEIIDLKNQINNQVILSDRSWM